MPETNCEIRVWYNFQVVAIPIINKYWIEQGYSLSHRAHMAFSIRQNARTYSRFMINDQEVIKTFESLDIEKYGNPNGPTFEYLFSKYKQEGHDDDEAYEAIIVSASKTNPIYDKECLINSN
ncbi:MAG: hypothetical protein AAGB35_05385 [Pseudomonadota bacterium]